MTMDLYGHMIDANLWQAGRLIGDTSGTSEPPGEDVQPQDIEDRVSQDIEVSQLTSPAWQPG
jgi:hypothetical protein